MAGMGAGDGGIAFRLGNEPRRSLHREQAKERQSYKHARPFQLGDRGRAKSSTLDRIITVISIPSLPPGCKAHPEADRGTDGP